jgi:uncharacterized protein (DUF924 family)
MEYQQILNFWFYELEAQDHFVKNDWVDEQIKGFADVHTAVKAGETAAWRETAQGALAEIIVLDQFSRNMFRGSAESFTQDARALELAQAAIAKGQDQELSPEMRLFMYMPYMHSESKKVHAAAVPLFESLGNKNSLAYEHIHKKIIDQFGRYPHRNEMMGRKHTPEETAYLAENVESFF